MYIKAKIWFIWNKGETNYQIIVSLVTQRKVQTQLSCEKDNHFCGIMWCRIGLALRNTPQHQVYDFGKKFPSARKPKTQPSALNHRQKSKQLFFELCEKPQEPRLFLPKVYKIPWLEHSEQSSPFPLKQFFSN